MFFKTRACAYFCARWSILPLPPFLYEPSCRYPRDGPSCSGRLFQAHDSAGAECGGGSFQRAAHSYCCKALRKALHLPSFQPYLVSRVYCWAGVHVWVCVCVCVYVCARLDDSSLQPYFVSWVYSWAAVQRAEFAWVCVHGCLSSFVCLSLPFSLYIFSFQSYLVSRVCCWAGG